MTRTGVRLGDIVDRLGGRLEGDPEQRVDAVATLESAGPRTLSFLANSRYRSQLPGTRAACVILGEVDAAQCPVAAIVAVEPYVYYARAAAMLQEGREFPSGRHPDASIAPDAQVAQSAWIGAQASIGSGARIGEAVFVGPGCVVGDGVTVGARSRLSAHVTILAGATIGSDCLFHPGVVIGGDGFGIAWDGERWLRVPQVGSVRIGNHVDIGANTAIDRGAIEDTVIEEGVKLDNLIQIGHNVRIGAHTVMAGCCGVSGSAVIGSYCQIGGQVGIAGHIRIADHTIVTGKTVVSHSIREPGKRYSGALPIDESRRWQRNSARFRSLDKMAKRLAHLERLHKDRKP
ncbi:MAG: UDP-3-O-(3-hydroxymyristoyl)glucosamine N-acyltransferase [Gammaproteobacteria bacterium]|nr:UDP-3-O-(3-hydroxymyristoyl)glucosamine N-acyltransferase [Gammaproteobacteria bacterium]